jgi:hypothetical protein
MLTCREVAELLSKDEFRDAPLFTRLAVKAHLAMCGHCTRFARQLAQIRTAVRKSFSHEEPDSEFESRMIRKLQR